MALPPKFSKNPLYIVETIYTFFFICGSHKILFLYSGLLRNKFRFSPSWGEWWLIDWIFEGNNENDVACTVCLFIHLFIRLRYGLTKNQGWCFNESHELDSGPDPITYICAFFSLIGYYLCAWIAKHANFHGTSKGVLTYDAYIQHGYHRDRP